MLLRSLHSKSITYLLCAIYIKRHNLIDTVDRLVEQKCCIDVYGQVCRFPG